MFGMIQRGSRPRLAAKTFQRLRIARDVLWKEFQRDTPTKFEVLSLVDNAHASRAELAHNAVMRDRLAYVLRRYGHF